MNGEQYTRWVVKRRSDATLTEAVLGIVSEAGEVAQVRRKHMQELTKDERNHMILELGDVMFYMALAAAELDVSLEEIMKCNMYKLIARDLLSNIIKNG